MYTASKKCVLILGLIIATSPYSHAFSTNHSSILSWHPLISFPMGKGVNKNNPTDTATDICVDIDSTPVSNENSSTVSTITSISLATNAKELNTALGVSSAISAKIEFLKLGGEGSANAKYDFSHDLTDNSLALVVAIGVNYGNYRVVPSGNDNSALKLKPTYQALLDNNNAREFRASCGSHFVQEVRRESLYVAIVKIKNISISDKRELATAINMGDPNKPAPSPINNDPVINPISISGTLGNSFKKKLTYTQLTEGKDASINLGINNFFKKASSIKNASTEIIFLTRGGNIANQAPIFTDVGANGEVITLNGILHALADYLKNSNDNNNAPSNPLDSLTTHPQFPDIRVFTSPGSAVQAQGKLPGAPAEYVLSTYDSFDRNQVLGSTFQINDEALETLYYKKLDAQNKKTLIDKIIDQVNTSRNDLEYGNGNKNPNEVAKLQQLKSYAAQFNDFISQLNSLGKKTVEQKISLTEAMIPKAPVVSPYEISMNLIIDNGAAQFICEILKENIPKEQVNKNVRCGDAPAASWGRDQKPQWKAYFKVTGQVSLGLLTKSISIQYLNAQGQNVPLKVIQYGDQDEQHSKYSRDGIFEIYFQRMTSLDGINAYKAMMANPGAFKATIVLEDLFNNKYYFPVRYNHVGDHQITKKR